MPPPAGFLANPSLEQPADLHFPAQQLRLLLALYTITCLLYYTATWLSYGGFAGGHPPFLDLEEFCSAAGTQFAICFGLTLLLLRFVLAPLHLRLGAKSLWIHVVLLPLFVVTTYLLVRWVQSWFGWVFVFGGRAQVWTFYLLGSFYVLQFGIVHAQQFYLRSRAVDTRRAWLGEAIGAISLEIPNGVGSDVLQANAPEDLAEITVDAARAVDFAKELLLSRGKHRYYVPVAELISLHAAGDYTSVHSTTGEYLAPCSIGELLAQLDPVEFLRIHRSTAVRRSAVLARRKQGREQLLDLVGGSTVHIGRKYLESVFKALARVSPD